MSKVFLITLLMALVLAAGVCPGYAASHNDAPLISQDPAANQADVYAFVSQNQDGAKCLELSFTVNPLEEPGNGVNYYFFGDDVRYSLHIVKGRQTKSGEIVFTSSPDVTYNFLFKRSYKNLNTILSYGNGTKVGPIEFVGDASQNLVQTYKVEKVDSRGRRTDVTGNQRFIVPPCNVGPRTTPKYYGGTEAEGLIQGAQTFFDLDQYTQDSIFMLKDGSRVFAGQRDDGFYADVPAIFDLLGLRNPGVDGFSGYNVHTIAVEVLIRDLIKSGDVPIVGVYATTSRLQERILAPSAVDYTSFYSNWVQVGRMGNPLFNEVLVALKDKDKYNRTLPSADQQFSTYAENPEIATLINAVIGTSIQTTGRTDLAGIFIPDVLKVDTSTDPVPLIGQPGFNRLTLFGGDMISSPFQGKDIPSGWPNGRRYGDDVVDIALTAVASGPSFSTIVPVGDNVSTNDLLYNQTFPYGATPHGGTTSSLHLSAIASSISK